MQANTQIDQRREFTEAVLGGVSSGVVGLDREGKVTLPNATARELLGRRDTDLIGKKLVDVVPEFRRFANDCQSEKKALCRRANRSSTKE